MLKMIGARRSRREGGTNSQSVGKLKKNSLIPSGKGKKDTENKLIRKGRLKEAAKIRGYWNSYGAKGTQVQRSNDWEFVTQSLRKKDSESVSSGINPTKALESRSHGIRLGNRGQRR